MHIGGDERKTSGSEQEKRKNKKSYVYILHKIRNETPPKVLYSNYIYYIYPGISAPESVATYTSTHSYHIFLLLIAGNFPALPCNSQVIHRIEVSRAAGSADDEFMMF